MRAWAFRGFRVLVAGPGLFLVARGRLLAPWALRMLVCVVILAAVVLVVKFAIRRRRPEGESASYRATDPHSFPSGHAARTFLIAVLASGVGPGWRCRSCGSGRRWWRWQA